MNSQCLFPPKLTQVVNQANHQHFSIVLVTGVFDLLHQEHLRFLSKAKDHGDILIVGIESDFRVQELKGKNRPRDNQTTRRNKVSNLSFVDYCFILPEEFHSIVCRKKLINLIKPKILAVSSHSPHLQQKKQLIQSVGGSLKIVHPHNPNISTTQIISSQTQVKTSPNPLAGEKDQKTQ